VCAKLYTYAVSIPFAFLTGV